jgi:glycosyltransferase involved in cell wall biosynthesis
MRVLMLTQSYPPIVGGEERAIEDLSLELAERGHDVAVATLRQPGGEPRRSAGVRVHALRSSVYRLRRLYGDAERRHAPPAPDLETMLDLRRVLAHERPDVVHAHNWLVHSYLPLDRRGGPALALTLHDYGLFCATKRLMRAGEPCSGPGPVKCVRCAGARYGAGKGAATALATRLGRPRLRRHVDLFLPVSEAVAELCGLDPVDACRVVPNFFRPLPATSSGDARLERLPREPFLLFFGDASEDKGAALLADAYASLERPPPLVFLGRCLVEHLGERPGVAALGPWPHALAMEALSRCLFAVVPSIWPEPFGLVALEAAAAGKPVVASDTGGLRDTVIDGETGLLVPPGDRRALVGALARLIAERDLRERMGEAASRRATAFGPETVVPAVEAAYRIAIERRRHRSRIAGAGR